LRYTRRDRDRARCASGATFAGRLVVIGACGLPLIGLACSPTGPVARPIGEARIVDPIAGGTGGVRWNASSTERFGLRRMAPAASETGASPLAWDTPVGWVEVAPAQMRQANFLAAGDPRAECYLTLLPGEAGGLAANVNRWRQQMSLPPLDADEVTALPRVPLFGADAALLDLEGTWTGMAGVGGAGDAGAYRMLGLLRNDPGGSRFLKLIGPADVVEAERDAFLALAASFRTGESGGEQATAFGDTPGDHADHEHDHEGGGGVPIPAGWRQAPARQFRDLNFFVGEGEQTECYVTILGGDGGGLRANVDRWRTQFGLQPATDDEHAGLERVPMMGREGELVELVSADGTAAMLGVVCMLEGNAVFVKMTGPRGTVEQERGAFLGFCAQMEEQR